MTIQWGDTGKVSLGPVKNIAISLATPREDNIATTPANFTSSMPTVQTSTVGATFTIVDSDLPVLNPSVPLKYCAILHVAGKNNSGGLANVSMQSFKNGSPTAVGSTSTFSSITSTNYWTFNVYRYPDVVVGDVLNVQVWASVANVTYDYCALVIYPTQVQPAKSGAILKDLTYSNHVQPQPLFTKGISTVNGNSGSYVTQITTTQGFTAVNGGGSPGTFIVPAYVLNSNLGYLYKTANGDSGPGITGVQNATSKPVLYQNWVPGNISFREVYL